MYVAAVTGTNGKTTTAEYARQLLARRPARTVSVGSLGTTDCSGSSATPFFLSEPGCWAEPVEELALDYDAAIFEAFSSGLSLREWDGVPVDTAVLTTLGSDHLDFHRTQGRYVQAKLRLFQTVLPRGKTAIVNTGCPLAAKVEAIAASRQQELLRYGTGGDVQFLQVSPVTGGLATTICAFGEKHEQFVSVASLFLAENALAAVCIALVAGLDMATVLDGLAELETPPGRMELVGTAANGEVLVDFAHSPEALQTVLADVRSRCTNRIILVFGCGGERDSSKRPAMGRIADEYADVVIVTDDNPRSEDASAIRRQVMAECAGALNVADRGVAIEYGVSMMEGGDILLICGKGCETEQARGETSRPWSDIEAASAALEARRHSRTSTM